MTLSLVEKIIFSAVKILPQTDEDFNALKRKLARLDGKKQALPDKTELLTAYHKLLKDKSIAKNQPLEKLLARRAVRSLSGVAIVTSLIKPYPCPGACVYCPLDERMPKSYLPDEPAAMRALTLKFDPYEQTAKRIEALENNGHPTDKIELIIKGGTWNSYPTPYQYWFVLRSYAGANELGKRKKMTGGTALNNNLALTETSPLSALRAELFRQQKINERSRHRIIGLTLETRPDCISERTMWQMRELGATRLELGVQHTDDAILKLTKRGHDSLAAKRATRLLKNFGFKTDYHLMPQLPGATPAGDLAMLKQIFSDPAYRPDMIKIYPCTVIKGSELYDWFKAGKFNSYPTEDLIDILKKFKITVPRWCRISRLIRDIPSQYIEAGNKITNLREEIQRQLKQAGHRCQCLRCREVGHRPESGNWKPKLFIDKYSNAGGAEYFLSFEDKARTMVFGFCRLRVDPNGLFPAFIRELHTYGQLVALRERSKKAAQHKGLGKKLMRAAEHLARRANAKTIAVISGVGVRPYYRALGYRLKQTYMIKNLPKAS